MKKSKTPAILAGAGIGLLSFTAITIAARLFDSPILILSALAGFILLIVAGIKDAKKPQKPMKVGHRKKFPVFPPAIKWAGFAVALAGLALLFVLKDERMWAVIVLGLWTALMSRDKTEDEMLLQVRLQAVFFAFSWGALMGIWWQLTDKGYPVAAGMTSMLLFYHLMFWIMKTRIRREK